MIEKWDKIRVYIDDKEVKLDEERINALIKLIDNAPLKIEREASGITKAFFPKCETVKNILKNIFCRDVSLDSKIRVELEDLPDV